MRHTTTIVDAVPDGGWTEPQAAAYVAHYDFVDDPTTIFDRDDVQEPTPIDDEQEQAFAQIVDEPLLAEASAVVSTVEMVGLRRRMSEVDDAHAEVPNDGLVRVSADLAVRFFR